MVIIKGGCVGWIERVINLDFEILVLFLLVLYNKGNYIWYIDMKIILYIYIKVIFICCSYLEVVGNRYYYIKIIVVEIYLILYYFWVYFLIKWLLWKLIKLWNFFFVLYWKYFVFNILLLIDKEIKVFVEFVNELFDCM